MSINIKKSKLITALVNDFANIDLSNVTNTTFVNKFNSSQNVLKIYNDYIGIYNDTYNAKLTLNQYGAEFSRNIHQKINSLYVQNDYTSNKYSWLFIGHTNDIGANQPDQYIVLAPHEIYNDSNNITDPQQVIGRFYFVRGSGGSFNELNTLEINYQVSYLSENGNKEKLFVRWLNNNEYVADNRTPTIRLPNIYEITYNDKKYLAIKLSELSLSSVDVYFDGIYVDKELNTTKPFIINESDATISRIYKDRFDVSYQIQERLDRVSVHTSLELTKPFSFIRWQNSDGFYGAFNVISNGQLQYYHKSDGTTPAFVIGNSSENPYVGINTTDPQDRLTVRDGRIRIENADGSKYSVLSVDPDTGNLLINGEPWNSAYSDIIITEPVEINTNTTFTDKTFIFKGSGKIVVTNGAQVVFENCNVLGKTDCIDIQDGFVVLDEAEPEWFVGTDDRDKILKAHNSAKIVKLRPRKTYVLTDTLVLDQTKGALWGDGTLLDFTGLPDNKVAIKIAGYESDKFSEVQRGKIKPFLKGLRIKGSNPSNFQDTTQRHGQTGIEAGYRTDTETYTDGFFSNAVENVSIENFDVGVRLLSRAYILNFKDCGFGYCYTCVELPYKMEGTTQIAEDYGERISFQGCTFYNSWTLVKAENGDADFYFNQCSFDYSKELGVFRRCNASFTDCHIELKNFEWQHLTVTNSAYVKFDGCRFVFIENPDAPTDKFAVVETRGRIDFVNNYFDHQIFSDFVHRNDLQSFVYVVKNRIRNENSVIRSGIAPLVNTKAVPVLEDNWFSYEQTISQFEDDTVKIEKDSEGNIILTKKGAGAKAFLWLPFEYEGNLITAIRGKISYEYVNATGWLNLYTMIARVNFVDGKATREYFVITLDRSSNQATKTDVPLKATLFEQDVADPTARPRRFGENCFLIFFNLNGLSAVDSSQPIQVKITNLDIRGL